MTKQELEYCDDCEEQFVKAEMYKTQDPWGFMNPLWHCEDCAEARFDQYQEGLVR